ELLRAPTEQHAHDLPVFVGGRAKDLAQPVALTEHPLGVAEDLLELALLDRRVEAEVVRVSHLRQLTLLGAEELLFDLGYPARRLEYADRPLRLEHALSETGEDLLIGAPWPCNRRRRLAGEQSVPEARGFGWSGSGQIVHHDVHGGRLCLPHRAVGHA